MKVAPRPGVQAAIAFAILAAIFGLSHLTRIGALDGPAGRLVAFSSDEELAAFLSVLRDRRDKGPYETMTVGAGDLEMGASQATAEEAPPPIDPITNVQEAGVDEGGIVKVRGDLLVILRRGRLFTVSLSGERMRAIDMIDAFPPGAAAEHAWYDEMLVVGERVIVIGYSYERGGTEINRFRLDPSGRLAFEDAYHLRSSDYFSSRNCASRRIGDKLILYTPLYLGTTTHMLDSLPAMRRWRGSATDRGFKRIADARQVYVPPVMRGDAGAAIDTMHSVTTCDLAAATLNCSAAAMLGPGSRSFYVSGEAVYLWLSDYEPTPEGLKARTSYIYRMPLAGGVPSAVRARGAPVDQFSFRADEKEGVLNVLVRAEGDDWMFSPEVSEGEVILVSAPLSLFGDASQELRGRHYRRLPSPPGESWWFHNRFVGDHILYGAGSMDQGSRRSPPLLYATSLTTGLTTELRLPNSVDRIEPLGRDAIVVGAAPGGLGFTAIDLSSPRPRPGDHYLHPMSAEGESRSHAFFYRPDPGAESGDSGVLGLPVAKPADPAFERAFGSAAAIAFLRRIDRRLSPMGELAARVEGISDDGCQASCVDWYGNARPIFLGRRTFALLGYELVEGVVARIGIREVARLSFAPPPHRRAAG